MGTTGSGVNGCGRKASGSGRGPGGTARTPRKRCLTVLAILLTPPALAACGAEARGAGEAVVRDSAGVTIVENQPDAEVPMWPVAPEPLLEIGGQVGDPSRELYRVRGVVRLPDGGLLVANAGTQELRFFGPDGSFRHASGGEGEGPGEYQGLNLVAVLGGDSLVAFDSGSRRVSVLGVDGEHARSFTLELPGEGGGSSFPWLRGVAGPERRDLVVHEGTVFMAGQVEPGLARDSVAYYLTDATGAVRDTLGRFPGTERWVRVSGRTMSVRTLPFGRSPELVATGSGFYQGSTDSYDIGYYGLDGELRRRIRLLRDPRPVTDADLEAYRNRVLAEVDEEARPETERRLRETPFPETMPAHGALHVDTLDHLWVKEYAPSFEEGPDVWRIYDPEGRQVAGVELPRGFTIYEIGEDYVLGHWQDDFDLEYVRLLALERGGGAG